MSFEYKRKDNELNFYENQLVDFEGKSTFTLHIYIIHESFVHNLQSIFNFLK